MAYITPPAWTPSMPASQDRLNILSNDIAFLFQKALSVTKRNNAGDYSTSSASFVDIDGTNLAATILCTTGRVRVTLIGTFYADAASRQMSVDFTMDGTRFNASFTNGLASETMDTNSRVCTFTDIKTGISAGSHTFKVQWLTGSGTAKLRSNTTQEVVTFIIEEI
jgi:hypothetical protein